MDFERIFTAANLFALAMLMVAFSVHELCHGVVAYALGDDTGKKAGRLTLNPIVHIDPFMTVVLPFLILVSTGGMGWFGGAKPMPVQPENFRSPRRDLAAVAAAGPLSNWILALLGVSVFLLLVRFAGVKAGDFGWNAMVQFRDLNLFLVILNLLPIPPLDGYKVIRALLPRKLAHKLDRLEGIGIVLVLLLLVLPWSAQALGHATQLLQPSVNWVVVLLGSSRK